MSTMWLPKIRRPPAYNLPVILPGCNTVVHVPGATPAFTSPMPTVTVTIPAPSIAPGPFPLSLWWSPGSTWPSREGPSSIDDQYIATTDDMYEFIGISLLIGFSLGHTAERRWASIPPYRPFAQRLRSKNGEYRCPRSGLCPDLPASSPP
jgi:hypothetical protein